MATLKQRIKTMSLGQKFLKKAFKEDSDSEVRQLIDDYFRYHWLSPSNKARLKQQENKSKLRKLYIAYHIIRGKSPNDIKYGNSIYVNNSDVQLFVEKYKDERKETLHNS